MKKNLFGTDGIRCTIGTEPLTPTSLVQLGRAIVQWAHAKYQHVPVILLGHDTRESCSLVKSCLQTGLLLNGAHIYDAYVIPTPTVCQIIKYNPLFDLGIIISASHNPYQDNGIKIIKAHHGKLTLEDEIAISTLFYEQQHAITYTNLGIAMPWHKAYQEYIAKLAHIIQPDFLQSLTIVLDCAHGATHELAKKIFEHFGAHTIVINNEPNGKNINHECGALHIQQLQQAVITHNADIGFAFDGDGDRVIAVNKHGQSKDGDDLLALLLTHPRYAQEKIIVGTIMTNQGFAIHVRNNNKQLCRVPVGDKYISEQLEKDKMLIGGEPSGHIILRDYLSTGDGIFTALRVLEAIMYTENWDMETFTKFPQVLINIPIETKKDLEMPQFATLIAQHEAQLHDGRLIVRYSGTESVLRVMVEDADLSTAQLVGTNLSQELAKKLSVQP